MAASPPKRVVRKLTLYSALPVQALLNQSEAGFVADPADKSVLRSQWEAANGKYQQALPSRSYLTAADIQPMSGVATVKQDALLRRVKSYPPYDSHPPAICKIRISKVVTPQIVVNLERAERRADIKSGLSDEELFKVMFESVGTPEPITRQTLGMAPTSGALLFTSYNEDIRLHHPPQYRTIPISAQDPNGPSLESVCFPVGGGLPFAAAVRVVAAPGISRLVLTNGVHRMFKLALAGYEWVPVLVTNLTPMEFPEQFADLPSGILLDPAANPPLVVDYTNPDLAIELGYFEVLKTIRLNWSFEQYATVLK